MEDLDRQKNIGMPQGIKLTPDGKGATDYDAEPEISMEYDEHGAIPVFTTGEFDYFHQGNKEKQEEVQGDEIYSRTKTDPIPKTLTLLYAQQMNEIVDGIGIDDAELKANLIRILDPLISHNAAAQKIYNALHAEMEKESDPDKMQKMWDIAVQSLIAVVQDMFDQLSSDLFDGENVLRLEKFFRTCLSKIISPTVRKYMMQRISELLRSDSFQPKQKQLITNAFSVAITNYQSINGQEQEIPGSDDTLFAFRKFRIPEPKTDNCTAEALMYTYPNTLNRMYDVLLVKSHESLQWAKALEFLQQTQNFGLLPDDIETFDLQEYIKLCHKSYSKLLRIAKMENDQQLIRILLSLWNEVIGPQLILVGELLIPSSQFLLPKPEDI